MLQEECKEKILSEEYRDFMMRDTGALGENFPLENGCRIPLKYGFELLYIDQSEDRKKPLGDYPYTMVPKCYTTLDMAAIQQAGIAAVQNLPGLELSGEGVLVGIIPPFIFCMNVAVASAQKSQKNKDHAKQHHKIAKHPDTIFQRSTPFQKQYPPASDFSSVRQSQISSPAV